ncbi:hypothetical protein DFJ63DRAFT_326582 [Scheffersomyces coipomensis]|uniref:uncharacterized protein n=1 Tax=Scheffersomyces coipomensis TaxID=1788519 RepID=UPI00315D4A84
MSVNEFDILSNPEYAEGLSRQIELTISNLIIKKDALVSQVDLYTSLQDQITSNERIRKDNGKVMVLLGDGYFVEKDIDDALEFLDRRIESLSDMILQFNNNINEANATRDNFNRFKEFSKQQQKGEVENEENNKEKLNEEGLPFMDIQEDLDDEDNIVDIKINNQRISRLELVQEKDQLQEIIAETKIQHIEEIIDEIPKPKLLESNSPSHETSTPDSDFTSNIDDQLTELFQDMEIIDKTDKSVIDDGPINPNDLLEKIDKLKVSVEDKFRLKQICLEEYKKIYGDKENIMNNESNQNQQESSTDDDVFTPEVSETSLDEVRGKEREQVLASIIKENHLNDSITTSTPATSGFNSVDKNDILELEILADEFDDTNELEDDENEIVQFDDNEDWDFDFSDEGEEDENDDDDEDEDYGDDILYGNRSLSLGPSQNDKATNMLWDQVFKLRKSNNLTQDNQNEVDEEEKSDPPKKKKSVRFSENLEINEIENISEELKLMSSTPTKKLSLFKQERIIQHNETITEVDERDYIDEEDEPLSDVIEKDILPPVEMFPEAPIKKVSKFKQDRLSSLQPNVKIIKDESSIKSDEPINRRDLINQSISESEDQVLVDSIPETENQVLVDSIIENEHAEESKVEVEIEEKPRKVSKFKANKLAQSKPVPIPIPEIPIPEPVDSIVDEIEHEDESVEGSVIRDTTLDYQSLQGDVDSMAKAYALGLYDDDIETHGPVVNKMEDFEILNKMIESMPSNDNNSSRTTNHKITEISNQRLQDSHVFDANLDTIEKTDYDEEDDEDGPILVDEIVENEFDEDGEGLEEDLDDTILDQEIITNYHKLRQKIIFENKARGYLKSDEELEFVPIDEDGNTLKVSRFKAARMN